MATATINLNPLIDAVGGATAEGATGLITAVVKAGGATGGLPAPRVSGAGVTLPYPVYLVFEDGVKTEPLVLDVLPVGYFWALTIEIADVKATYNFIIPAAATYDFNELTFVDPSTMEEIPLYVVEVDYVQFNTDGSPVADTEGKMVYNPDERTVDLAVGNNVVLQVGQELHFYGKAIENIPNGTPVMSAGVQGDHILFKKAIADGSTPSSFIMGVATETIAANGFGLVTWFGRVRGFNTTAFEVGDILYVSGTTAGAFVTTPPAQAIEVAIVLTDKNNGEVLVRPTWS